MLLGAAKGISGPPSLLPADFGFLHGPQVGIVDDVLLPVPAACQGAVLLQHRGVLLLRSCIILAQPKTTIKKQTQA